MGISNRIGNVAGKVVKAAKVAPTKTTSTLKDIKNDLTEGFRDVVPAKNKNQ